ncbi:MAG: hypothetical protein NC308_03930, partial [Clostridium sp.]|nr:hypothetical protein [Bacteroides sp.]MCM1198017.1 hypothetical protein [Clostridium sp.]
NMLYDYENTIDYARQQGIAEGEAIGEARGREAGLAEGREAGKIEIAKVLKSRGMSETEICSITGLPESLLLELS